MKTRKRYEYPRDSCKYSHNAWNYVSHNRTRGKHNDSEGSDQADDEYKPEKKTIAKDEDGKMKVCLFGVFISNIL
jgi:hypothetical protein